MAHLTDSERRDIVRSLATFESPVEVAKWASEEFGKDISRQQVEHYDPTRCDQMAERWQELFQRTREEFLQDLDSIPIAHRAVRLRKLMEYTHELERGGEYEKASAMLKQAAKEMGEKFTNVQQVQQDGSQTIEVVYTDE